MGIGSYRNDTSSEVLNNSYPSEGFDTPSVGGSLLPKNPNRGRRRRARRSRPTILQFLNGVAGC